MRGLKIVGSGSYAPKNVISNEDFVGRIDTSDEWITSRTGIKRRHFSDGEANWEVALNAANIAISDAGINKSDIDLIIVATFTPDYATPSVSCILQKNLELRNDIMAFDINAACSGFLYALETANALMENKEGYALVIGSEQISTRLDMTDRGTCVLFGDGAGAVVVKKDNTEWISVMGAMGNEIALGCHGGYTSDRYIFMDGKDVFKFAVKTIPQVIDNLLKKADMNIEQIDHIICHQANERIIKHVAGKYKTVQDRFYMNIQEYGNTSAASIPIAFDEMIKKGVIKKNDNVIMVGFGAGFTWAGVLMKGVLE